MDVNCHLMHTINRLENLLFSMQHLTDLEEKLTVLNELPHIQAFIDTSPHLQRFLKNLDLKGEFAFKSVIAIEQGPVVFNLSQSPDYPYQNLVDLLEQLLELEVFYHHSGGIIGYHVMVLRLITQQQIPVSPIAEHIHYIHPEGLNLSSSTREGDQAVRWGIENVERIAALFPLGGAGDRLNLLDDATGTPLPAALLPFLGFTLLESLIRDLQAQEYLAFKLTGQQSTTPVAIMTSSEKNNHLHVLNVCKKAHWFGRPPASFYFFIQPLVPVITYEGYWSLSAPLNLTLKPSGHGVIWKLAEEQGIFEWLEKQGRHYFFVRQINNPVAATDNSVFALMGMGIHHQKSFGFVSCERLLRSDEGTNVLIETVHDGHYDYCLTNIEYTDFMKRSIDESPSKAGSPYSRFPTNTNILFADLAAIRKALEICPIPGRLINMKTKAPYIDPEGNISHVSAGRLESTMQNIADYFVDSFPLQLTSEEMKEKLKTFIVYNKRSKTISPTKKAYKASESPYSTPEQAFYDLLSNHYQLFSECLFQLPEWRTFEEYLQQGPSCILLFHPALGPLYSVISQKIRRGKLSEGAEVQLEMAEVDIEDLQVEGSLIIQSNTPLGTTDEKGILHFGGEARCVLKKVKIKNKGLGKNELQNFWKNEMKRLEEVRIILHEGAEFHAENLELSGPHRFEVPAHHRLVLHSAHESQLTPIETPTWAWKYSFNENHSIQLSK